MSFASFANLKKIGLNKALLFSSTSFSLYEPEWTLAELAT